MIGALHEIRDIAIQMRKGTSINDTRREQMSIIIDLCNLTLAHDTDDRGNVET